MCWGNFTHLANHFIMNRTHLRNHFSTFFHLVDFHLFHQHKNTTKHLPSLRNGITTLCAVRSYFDDDIRGGGCDLDVVMGFWDPPTLDPRSHPRSSIFDWSSDFWKIDCGPSVRSSFQQRKWGNILAHTWWTLYNAFTRINLIHSSSLSRWCRRRMQHHKANHATLR